MKITKLSSYRIRHWPLNQVKAPVDISEKQKHTDTRNLQGVQLREMQKINSLGTTNDLTFLYDYLVYHT